MALFKVSILTQFATAMINVNSQRSDLKRFFKKIINDVTKINAYEHKRYNDRLFTIMKRF